MNYRGLTPHHNIEEIFLPIDTKKQHISNRFLLTPIFEYLKYRYRDQPIQQIVESRNNQQFYVKFRLQEKGKTVMTGDKVYPQVMVENSYDASLRPKIGVGYVRQICTNGMLRFYKFTEVKVNQSESAEAYMEQLLPILEELEDMEVQVTDFKKLAQRQLNPSEMNWIVREINQATDIRFNRRMIRRALLTASLEADQLSSNMNAWLLYNGFNYTLNHLPFAFAGQNLKSLDQRILETINKVTQPNYQPILLPASKKQKAFEQLEKYTSRMIRETSGCAYY